MRARRRFRRNPPRIAILLGALVVLAGLLAYTKRDVLSQFVKGTTRVPGKKAPVRIVTVDAAKGMIVG